MTWGYTSLVVIGVLSAVLYDICEWKWKRSMRGPLTFLYDRLDRVFNFMSRCSCVIFLRRRAIILLLFSCSRCTSPNSPISHGYGDRHRASSCPWQV
ncbi:hypothetical protein EDB19DRAFT_1758184 [Suillus lakei]|nr:hypothetical protein EDB19DRAFT_1758184 [Suillus lakei]